MAGKEKLTPHNINLYDGDLETLQQRLPPRVASLVIRNLVRNYIRAKWPDGSPQLETEVDL